MERPEIRISEELASFLSTIPEIVADELLTFVEAHARDRISMESEQTNVAGLLRMLHDQLDADQRLDVLLRHSTLPVCAQLAALMLVHRAPNDQRRQRLVSALDTHWLQPWAAQTLLIMNEGRSFHQVLGRAELDYEDEWIDADMALKTLGAVLYRYGNEEAVPLIRLALNFPDHRIRFTAADLLSPRHADEATIAALVAAIEDLQHPSNTRTEKAFENLSSISPALIKRIPHATLMRSMLHTSPSVRKAVIDSVSVEIENQPAVRQRLQRVRTADTHPEVRVAAMKALLVLGETAADAEEHFLAEFRRPDAGVFSDLLTFVVDSCRLSEGIRAYLYLESVGATQVTRPIPRAVLSWRRFWATVALSRLIPSDTVKALELFRTLPANMKSLAPTIFPHAEILQSLGTWAAEPLCAEFIKSAENDFLFSNHGGGDVRAGNEKIHRVEGAFQVLADSPTAPADDLMKFTIDFLLRPLSMMGEASDYWSQARQRAGLLLVRHGDRNTLEQLEARLPAADQPNLIEEIIRRLREELTGKSGSRER